MEAWSRSDPEAALRRPKKSKDLSTAGIPTCFAWASGAREAVCIGAARVYAYFLAASGWASISLSQRPQVSKRLSAIEIGWGGL
jgi:hypothetical protein